MSRRWIPVAAGVSAASIGALWLAFWLVGDREFVAFRMKTNTCVSMVLIGTALTFRARGLLRTSTVLALGASLVGAATLFQYASGIDLAIDELLVRDAWTAESAAFPNRMAPNAALSILLAGLAFPLLASGRRRFAAVGQLFAVAVFAIAALAVIGYFYQVAALYQPTSFIRMAFSTSLALLIAMIGLLATRPDLGLVRVLASEGPGGILLRRLLPVGIAIPIAFGWIEIRVYEAKSFPEQTVEALVAVLVAAFITLAAVRIAWIVEDLHQKRVDAQLAMSRSEMLTSALALAATVDEVAASTLDIGLPALEASGGAVFLLENGELRTARAHGYESFRVEAFARFPIDSRMPAAVAARERRAVFVETPEELSRDGGAIPTSHHHAWAALPLEGRDRLLGVLGLSFASSRRFDEATRSRLQRVAWQCGQALDRALLFDSEKLARERAESASAAKDQFLAMLGHELRNPLSPILTSLQLMKMNRPGPQRERDVIERQVQHMVRLVDDLLDISRITQGKVVLQKVPVEIGRVIAAAIETSSPLLEAKRHHLTLEVGNGLWVDGDPQRLAQVLANLVMNAAKYTDEGGRISVAAVREGGEVVVRVRDNGTGISPALLPQVFDQFVQGRQTIDRSAGGLGLGLAIVRSLMTMHGGRVFATSDGDGKGSEFSVALPSREAPPVLAARPDSTATSVPAAALEVLVVDDNVDAANTLSDALRFAGHRVRTAFDGPSALALARVLAPELVFLDLGLPVMDGFEVARQLRAAAGNRPLRLVAVTGYGQPADREQAAAAGFDHHLVKPVSLDVVLSLATSHTA